MKRFFNKSKFVQIVCNILQFVQIRILGYLPLLALLLPLFWAFAVVAQDSGSSDAGGSGSSSGGGGGGGGGGDPPPEMISWGTFYCNILSRIVWVLPSTPSGLTLSALASQAANSVPFVGDQIIYLIFRDLLTVLGLVVAIKLIKIIPAKF